jgi:hypothetical protein
VFPGGTGVADTSAIINMPRKEIAMTTFIKELLAHAAVALGATLFLTGFLLG